MPFYHFLGHFVLKYRTGALRAPPLRTPKIENENRKIDLGPKF